MEEAIILVFLLGSLGVTAIARRKGWPAPLVLVGVGLVVSLLPIVPHFELSPHILLGLVLPPLLYSAALSSSYQDLRTSLPSIVRLGVGLVVVTAFAVAGIVIWLFPGIPFAAALVLGAVVAPPDAVSAVAVGKRLGLPRRVMTVLTGESLINDATSLTLYKVALAGLAGGAWSISEGLSVFAIAVIVGIGVGLILGFVAHRIRIALSDPPVEITLGLVVPFAAYWLAEELQGSGVLAVVAAGLYLGHHATEAGYATRLQEAPLWQTLDLALETLTFALIGLQLKWVIGDVNDSNQGLSHALILSGVVLAAVIVVRPLYVFASSRVDHIRLPGSPRPAKDSLTVKESAVVAWAGMRGVVTMAAAAAIPIMIASMHFPERATLQLAAYLVTIGTLLLQGLTLPWLIKRLAMSAEVDEKVDAAQEMRMRILMSQAQAEVVNTAADRWAKELGTDEARKIADRLSARILQAGAIAAQTLREDTSLSDLVPPTTAVELPLTPGDPSSPVPAGMNSKESFKQVARARGKMIHQLRRELIGAEREVLASQRDAGNLNETVMRRLLLEIDLAEESLTTSWLSRTTP